ncbi:MAG: DEAD/DEAH box helicase family protein [Zoogloeaceae bacterium]|nr:DEAD/DEAH box helicase family protein [Zoogloeaceae bacterium]
MSELFSTSYDGANFPPMRPFQDEAHRMLREGFARGHKNQIIMAPTGAGKTVLALRIIHEALLKGKRAVFVCDRTVLINQTSAVADSLGMNLHGIIQANHWRRDEKLPLQIASAQTLAKRQFWPDADVIVVDESHVQHKVWTEYAKKTKAAVIGLSATPFSKGLGKIFSNLINATTMRDLVDSGVLVPLRVLSGVKPDMKGAKTKSSGEWDEREVEKRGRGIIGDVTLEWTRHAQNAKTIVFGATIAHCDDLCRQFNEAGALAMTYTSETSDAERAEIMKEFQSPDSAIRLLISVEALSKGLDVPDLGCVVDCRPLRKSLSTAIQMWGRGMRSAPGKTECLLLDHSGNIQRFKKDYEEIYFNGLDKLDSGEKMDKKIREDEEEKETRACPACGYQPFYKRCMSCGYEKPAPERAENEAGEMVELQIGGKAPKASREDKYTVWQEVCGYVRDTHKNPATAKGRAYYLFKEVTGKFPPNFWRFDHTEPKPTSLAVFNKIRSRQIKWIKSRQKAESVERIQA